MKLKPFTKEDKQVLTAIEDQMWYGECKTFILDTTTSSATKCKFCGKEKWQHEIR